jgi:hypothetical protein
MCAVTDEIRPDVPEAPPAQVLDAVYAAHARLEELAGAGTGIDLDRDPRTGRLVVTLRGPAVSRRLTGAQVFDLLD